MYPFVQVIAVESSQAAVDRGLGMMRKSLDIFGKKEKEKGKITVEPAAYRDSILSKVTTSVDRAALAECDIVVEVGGE